MRYAKWFDEMLARMLDADDAAELLARPELAVYLEDDERDLVEARRRFEADQRAGKAGLSWSGSGANSVAVLDGGLLTTMRRGYGE